MIGRKHTDMSLAFIDDLGEKGEVRKICTLRYITLTTLSMFYFISMGELYFVTDCKVDHSNPEFFIGQLCSTKHCRMALEPCRIALEQAYWKVNGRI